MRCCWLLALVGCGRLGFDPTPAGDGALDDAEAPGPLRVAYIKASNSETFDDFGYAIALSADGTTLAVAAPQEDSSTTVINGNQNDNTVSANGAVYIFAREDAGWVQQAYLKTNNPGMNDFFGAAVALSADGDTLVATAIGEDTSQPGIDPVPDELASDAGAAYVFVRTGVTWSQQAFLKATNPDAGDAFGISAAITGDGNTIAIGADSEASNATGVNGTQTNNLASGAGAVYIFTRLGATWRQEAYVKASNTEIDDGFGFAVALSGDGTTLAVVASAEDSGAPGINGNQADNTVTSSGAAYVFTGPAPWMQQAYIKSDLPGFGDYFCRRLALAQNGNTLLCAGPGEDAIVPNSGAAYVLTREGATWSQAQKLKASNVGDGDQFSADVALAGDGRTLVIGAPFEDSSAMGLGGNQLDDGRMDSGACYAFTRTVDVWSQIAYGKAPAPSAGDQMGFAMAISSNGATLAVAAPFEDSAARGIDGDATDDSAQDAGAVIVFYR